RPARSPGSAAGLLPPARPCWRNARRSPTGHARRSMRKPQRSRQQLQPRAADANAWRHPSLALLRILAATASVRGYAPFFNETSTSRARRPARKSSAAIRELAGRSGRRRVRVPVEIGADGDVSWIDRSNSYVAAIKKHAGLPGAGDGLPAAP